MLAAVYEDEDRSKENGQEPIPAIHLRNGPPLDQGSGSEWFKTWSDSCIGFKDKATEVADR